VLRGASLAVCAIGHGLAAARELAGRSVRACPGDQRLRRAAGRPMAGLQAAAGGASARAGRRRRVICLSLRADLGDRHEPRLHRLDGP
jgi:hypothetical protein